MKELKGLKARFWGLAIFTFTFALLVTNVPAQAGQEKATDAESREARELAVRFTEGFVNSKDLSPVVKELYFADFADRHRKFRLGNPDFSGPRVFFAPGLDYDAGLLKQSSAADWQRFYIAVNNVLLLGMAAGFEKLDGREPEDIEPTDLFPLEVLRLLEKNPNLANFVLKKGPSRAVRNLEEMQTASAVLDQAAKMIRLEREGKPILKLRVNELAELSRQSDFFEPDVVIMDESYFGFPIATRMLTVNTPLGLSLMLARDGNRLKIFWTEPITD